MKALFVSGREYRRVSDLLVLERSAASMQDRKIKSLQEALSEVRSELGELREAHNNECKKHARTTDTCQRRTNELSREKQAHHETRKQLEKVAEELRQANLRLDLGRDRRERIGKELDDLREASTGLCEAATCVIRFILANSQGGSIADAEGVRLRKACEAVEGLLNN